MSDLNRRITEIDERLKGMPEFAKLSFTEQRIIRTQLLWETLEQDPQAREMNPQSKMHVLKELVMDYRPVLEDKQAEQDLGPLFEMVERGDDNWENHVKQYALNHSFFKENVFGRLIEKPIIRPLSKLVEPVIADEYKWTWNMDALTGSDSDKAMEYMLDVGSKHSESIRKTAGKVSTFGSVLAFVGDYAVMHTTWVGLTGGAVKVGAAAIAAKNVGWKASISRSAFPAFVSGTSSGAYGIFREHFLGVVNDQDERRQDSFKKIAKTYGRYAVLDYAVNLTLGTVIPHLRLLRHLKTGVTSKALKKYTPEQLDILIKHVTEGSVAPELLDQLDDISKKYILGQADLRKAASRVGSDVRLRPYDDLLIEGNAAGMSVYRDPSTGKISLYRMNAKTDVLDIIETDDIVEAKREVAKSLRAKLESLPDDVFKENFRAVHNEMLNYDIADRAINSSFDPMKVGGNIDPDARKILTSKGRAKNFKSPVDRPYVGQNEVGLYTRAFGKDPVSFVGKFKVRASDEVLDRVSKGQMPFSGGRAVELVDGAGNADAFVMLRNPVRGQYGKAAFDKATELAQKAKAQGAGETLEELRNMYLMEAGFDGIVFNPGKVQMFYPDKVKFVAEKFDPIRGVIGEPDIFKAVGSPITARATVEKAVSHTVAADDATRKLFVEAAAKFKGDLNPQEINNLSKMYLRGANIDLNKVSVRVMDKVDSVPLARTTKDLGYVIEVPKKITNPKAQKAFVEGLFEQLNDIKASIGAGVLKPIPAKTVNSMLAKSASKFIAPFTTTKAKTEWLRGVVEDTMMGKLHTTPSGLTAVLKNGRKISANTVDGLTDRLIAESLGTDFLKFDLSRQGYRLTQVGDNLVVRGGNLSQPISARTPTELMQKMNYRPSKMSSEFAPKVTRIDPDAINVEFREGVAVGSKSALRKMLANFEDINHKASLKQVRAFNNGTVYSTSSGSFEVHMPEQGIIKKFGTSKEAQRFVMSEWKQYDSLKAIAEAKGLEFWYDKGLMKISDGVETFTAKNAEEVGDIFRKNFPDSTGAREIFEELDPDILNPIDRVLANFDTSSIPDVDTRVIKVMPDMAPATATGEVHQTVKQFQRKMTQSTQYWAEKTFKEIGRPDVLRQYNNLETARRAAQQQIDQTNEAIRGIFTRPDGKAIPLERRKAIFYHMGAQSAGEQARAVEVFGNLTESEQVVAQNLRTLLGTVDEGTGVVTGLAGKFGIKPEEFIKNYMPRIKEWSVKNREQLNRMITSEELIDAVFKGESGSAPKHLTAFFKNMRTSDVLAFVAEDDPIRVLDLYNKIGHRQQIMGEAWNNLHRAMASGETPEWVWSKMNRYKELLMGVRQTDGQVAAREFGKAVGKKLGIRDGEDLVNAYFSVNYLSNMGWRPWLAIRNSTQVWTTLAPRMGNHWVNEAVSKVNNLGEDGYKYLMRLGLIQDAPPVANTIMDNSTLLGRLTHKGLAMFKRSDDITRAVAYYTGEVRFNDALSKMKRGVITNMDDFLKESGVSKMDDDLIGQVRRLMAQGTDEGHRAAQNAFSMKLSDDTMFAYRASQSPDLFTGSFLGKMFGQYGTYSAGYRANLWRGLSQGSLADKVGFTARFLGNQAALFGAFTALGINARNFIPGMPGLFGGGPQWEVGVALMESFSSDYRGQQARAKLNRFFSPIGITKRDGAALQYPEMLPGSLQFRYYRRAFEYLERGDYWRAFLAATTTPVIDEGEMSPLRKRSY